MLIGAGSAVFTRGLVADLILSPELGPWEIRLVDIDPEALAVAEGLARRMVAARAPACAWGQHRPQRPARRGLVCTIGVGERAWEADVAIPGGTASTSRRHTVMPAASLGRA